MIYSSVLAMVVSALAAESFNNTSKQAWQKLYVPGCEDEHHLVTLSGSVERGDISKMDADCWVFARLHGRLPPDTGMCCLPSSAPTRAPRCSPLAVSNPLVASHAPKNVRHQRCHGLGNFEAEGSGGQAIKRHGRAAGAGIRKYGQSAGAADGERVPRTCWSRLLTPLSALWSMKIFF